MVKHCCNIEESLLGWGKLTVELVRQWPQDPLEGGGEEKKKEERE